MAKFIVTASVKIAVELDETKFTDAFMERYRETYYPFDSVEDHAMYIAELEQRGLLTARSEGYGDIKEFGIKAHASALVIDGVERVAE